MRRNVLLLLIVSLATSAVALGQEASDIADQPRFRFGLAVDAVHLNATVIDKKGRLVTDLEREDFRVLEDNVIQEVTYFSRGQDSPVDVVLLVDASGSMDMTEKTVNARNAAIQLIHGLNEEDRVSVYAFDRELYRLSEFSPDKQQAIDAMTKLEPFGSTALYDAVSTLSRVVIHEGFGRRAIVVVTDGIDTSSDATVEEAVEKAKGVDLPVYAIRVLSPVDDPQSDLFLGVHGASYRGHEALRKFTAETGGAMFEGSQWGHLAVASAKIHEELKTQYRIGYVPTNQNRDGRFRTIQVVPARRRGIEVRTRQGYYPNPGQSTPEPIPSRSATEKRSYR
jgi:VWFA-related protein